MVQSAQRPYPFLTFSQEVPVNFVNHDYTQYAPAPNDYAFNILFATMPYSVSTVLVCVYIRADIIFAFGAGPPKAK